MVREGFEILVSAARYILAQDALAGWAQAIGATVAIALTWRLARTEIRESKARDVEQMKVALYLLASALDHLSRAVRSFENENSVVSVAHKLLNNEVLRHTRESIARAEERAALPVAAYAALVAGGSDISRAFAVLKDLVGRNASDKVPAFRGAVKTLENRCRELADLIRAQGGRGAPGDPVFVTRWLQNWTFRPTLRDRLPKVFRWASRSSSPLARWMLSRVFKTTFMRVDASGEFIDD